jgi:hypothetical protein
VDDVQRPEEEQRTLRTTMQRRQHYHQDFPTLMTALPSGFLLPLSVVGLGSVLVNQQVVLPHQKH